MKLLAVVTLFFASATVHAADGSLRGVEVSPDGRELWSFDWTNIMFHLGACPKPHEAECLKHPHPHPGPLGCGCPDCRLPNANFEICSKWSSMYVQDENGDYVYNPDGYDGSDSYNKDNTSRSGQVVGNRLFNPIVIIAMLSAVAVVAGAIIMKKRRAEIERNDAFAVGTSDQNHTLNGAVARRMGLISGLAGVAGLVGFAAAKKRKTKDDDIPSVIGTEEASIGSNFVSMDDYHKDTSSQASVSFIQVAPALSRSPTTVSESTHGFELEGPIVPSSSYAADGASVSVASSRDPLLTSGLSVQEASLPGSVGGSAMTPEDVSVVGSVAESLQDQSTYAGSSAVGSTSASAFGGSVATEDASAAAETTLSAVPEEDETVGASI